MNIKQKEWRNKNKEYLKEYNKKWYKNNKKRALKWAREYRIKNRKIILLKNKKYREINKLKLSKQRISNRYNISIKEYEFLLKSQKNKCAICGISQNKCLKKLGVDHDHSTKKVRGLLCGNCNRALGLFKDSISSLEEAIKYLQKSSLVLRYNKGEKE